MCNQNKEYESSNYSCQCYWVKPSISHLFHPRPSRSSLTHHSCFKENILKAQWHAYFRSHLKNYSWIAAFRSKRTNCTQDSWECYLDIPAHISISLLLLQAQKHKALVYPSAKWITPETKHMLKASVKIHKDIFLTSKKCIAFSLQKLLQSILQ